MRNQLRKGLPENWPEMCAGAVWRGIFATIKSNCMVGSKGGRGPHFAGGRRAQARKDSLDTSQSEMRPCCNGRTGRPHETRATES